MLTQLIIKNFLIITELELEFSSGLTALTGETGAGKSILLDALQLALGEQASLSLLRPGAERLEIQAEFLLPASSPTLTWLQEHDLDDGLYCRLRRILTQDGGSRANINGQPCRLPLLRELSPQLIYFHSQHASQTLLQPSYAREFLDGHLLAPPVVRAVREAYETWQSLQTLLQEFTTRRQAHIERLAWLDEAITELSTFDLSPQALTTLEHQFATCTHAKKILQLGANLVALLGREQPESVLATLRKLTSLATELARHFPTITQQLELVHSASIQLEEFERALHHQLTLVSNDPQQLHELNQKITALENCARKYRVQPDELGEYLSGLVKEREALQTALPDEATLKQQFIQSEVNYMQCANSLTRAREAGIAKVIKHLKQILPRLGLAGATFKIELNPTAFPTRYGNETVQWFFSANPGQSLQVLAKAASGGELSRLSLALATTPHTNAIAPTAIFDEVDTGIGGETAVLVGELLDELAQTQQVFCITHLPQVAANAAHHFNISKSSTKGQTHLDATLLSPAERVSELARMLSGKADDSAARRNAERLLSKVD